MERAEDLINEKKLQHGYLFLFIAILTTVGN
jgi:hypothetical protein